MRIIFLKTSRESFQWFALYYEQVFNQGKPKAYNTLEKILKTLKIFPEIGNLGEGAGIIRFFHIPKTPFSLLYFIKGNDICVLRMFDNRKSIDKQDLLILKKEIIE